MLTQIFTSARRGYMSCRQMFSRVAQGVAVATCPAENTVHLRDCYADAERVRGLVYRMTETPNREVGFLRDFFEMRPDGFTSYADLMAFWGRADTAFAGDDSERFTHPQTFRLLRAAAGFTHSFTELPKHSRALVNLSLTLHADIIVRHIEAKSAEFVHYSCE